VVSPIYFFNISRLSYDRNQPWEKEIDYYDNFVADVEVATPKSYIVPQEWRDVIQRLQWNRVGMQRATETKQLTVQIYHIKNVKTRPVPYEGHMFHDEVCLDARTEVVTVKAGDYLIDLNHAKARYEIETLEPQGHDSFFRWGFFNSILEKKKLFQSMCLRIPLLNCWKLNLA
jgi:hypothetical protein